METNKAPRLNGFSAGFFQKNWEIFRKDVWYVVKEFFGKGKLLKQWNKTLLILIPKTQEAKDFKHYRPIILCNVTYKIITKIMEERLKTNNDSDHI